MVVVIVVVDDFYIHAMEVFVVKEVVSFFFYHLMNFVVY